MPVKRTKRIFTLFAWKDALYRISSPSYDIIVNEIKHQRYVLENYIRKHPAFKTSLTPLPLLSKAPPIAEVMSDAALVTNVGPMAGVAGAIAHAGVTAACRDGADEAIIENGGDIYLTSTREILVGLYSGGGKLTNALAFLVKPDAMPLALCSSSSHMGHSGSFGNCDLATVTAKNGALADAAATLVCNSVKSKGDIEIVLERTITIPGILGVLIIKDDHIGMIGELPELVKNADPEIKSKITHDPVWIL
ncbi:MAG: UPF0280 family protein [Spirochaetales bacterium]|nr:UPF0280 family protein [Spirochaetales bacterium]